MDFTRIEEDEGHELFFEGPEPEPEPEAPAPAAKRKRPARGARIEAEVPPAPALPQPAPAPAEAAPAPAPAPHAPRASKLPAAAMGLAALAATLSAAGLLVTQRNLAALHGAEGEVAGQAAALARVPALVTELEALASRQRGELDRAAASRPPEALTRDELERQLDGLRLALSKMQAPGTSALAGKVSAGQSELSDRIEQLARRMDARGEH